MIKYLLTELGRELAAFVLYVIISSQIVSCVALPPWQPTNHCCIDTCQDEYAKYLNTRHL